MTPGPPDIPPDELAEYRRLAARLPQRNEVGLAANYVLTGKRPINIDRLILVLNDVVWTRQERRVAAWVLGRTTLTRAERDQATKALRRLLARRSNSLGRTMRRLLIMIGVLGLVVLAGTTSGANALLSSVTVILMIAALVLALPLAILSVMAFPIYILNGGVGDDRATRAAAALALGRLGAFEAIPELGAALHDAPPPSFRQFLSGGTSKVREAAREALRAILPALTPEQYGLLPTEAITALGRMHQDPDRELAFMALEALDKVGTPAAIPYLERAVEIAVDMDFRDRAIRVLAVLRERESHTRQAQTLLRPAVPVEGNSLLRPAAATETPEELLLRPSAGEEAEARARNNDAAEIHVTGS